MRRAASQIGNVLEAKTDISDTPPPMQPALPALPPIPATEVVISNPELPQGASKQWHPVTSMPLTTDLVPAAAKMKTTQTFPVDTQQQKRPKIPRPMPHGGSSKKTKRYTPYELKVPSSTDLDESLLLDTPVVEADIPDPWALVVGPQQPPCSK